MTYSVTTNNMIIEKENKLTHTYGFFNPLFAEKTSFFKKNLSLFCEALQKMWDIDRSAARGFMALRGLYVFSHESKLGNAPAQALYGIILQ